MVPFFDAGNLMVTGETIIRTYIVKRIYCNYMTEQRASKNFRSSVISELGGDIGFSWAIVYEVAMPCCSKPGGMNI